MKFRCIPNETIRMDDKKLGKADVNGIMEVDEKMILDIFVERMRRAHKYLIEPTEKLVEKPIVENSTEILVEKPIVEKKLAKKPRAKK